MGELWSEIILYLSDQTVRWRKWHIGGYKRNDLGGDASGGAIFNTNGWLNLILTVLSGNTSTGGYMGGRAAGGARLSDTGTFEAVSSLFQMNSVNGGGGNAFSVWFF